MSTFLEAISAELAAMERELLESVAETFEGARQRLTVLAVEPGGNDRRAEPGSPTAIGKVEIVGPKRPIR